MKQVQIRLYAGNSYTITRTVLAPICKIRLGRVEVLATIISRKRYLVQLDGLTYYVTD
jgi:hypothetical protein